MKVLKVAAPVIVLVLIVSLCLPVFGSEFPRHVDPAKFKAESPDPHDLFAVYSAYLSHLSNLKWSEAAEALQISNEIYAPPDLDPTKGELESIGRDLILDLENARRNMEKAVRLVQLSEFERARGELESALFWLARYNREAGNFDSVSGRLASELNIDLPVSFRENFKTLENSIESTTSEVRRALEEGVENLPGEKLPYLFKPRLEVSVPETVLPGKSFMVEGLLEVGGKSPSGIVVELNWLNQTSAVVTDNRGRFSTSLDVPAGVSSGGHILKIRTQPENEIGPASVRKRIMVARISSDLVARGPRLVISGTSLTIRGKVSSDNEGRGGSKVRVAFLGESSSVKAFENGEFVATVGVSVTTFSGSHAYKITAVPEEPWMEYCERKGKVVVLNPLTMILTPVLVGVILVIWRRGKGRGGEREKIPEMETVGEEAIPGGEDKEIEGIRGLFLKALNMVWEFTGIRIGPSQTIREYLGAVRERLGEAFGPFERLSLKFEEFLYSDHEVRGDRSVLDKILDLLGGE